MHIIHAPGLWSLVFSLNLLLSACGGGSSTPEAPQPANDAPQSPDKLPTVTPPVVTPPVETPPVETPPVETPPVETPPVETPPVETPPVETPPVETPPVETPPVETPPVETPPVETPPVETPPVETPPVDPVTLDPAAPTADYKLTIENYWSQEAFPQDYPDDAHLSFIGGATHNAAVSFWSVGEPPTAGIEDMAETGRIDILIEEDIRPAIAQGTADSIVELREYTDAPKDGKPGTLDLELALKRSYPLLTLVTMLGPSPDWFVGVDGLSLMDENGWVEKLEADLPLYDGGSKSNMTPVMHGPGIFPPDPIGYVRYDESAGVYLATENPQIVARLVLQRIR